MRTLRKNIIFVTFVALLCLVLTFPVLAKSQNSLDRGNQGQAGKKYNKPVMGSVAKVQPQAVVVRGNKNTDTEQTVETRTDTKVYGPGGKSLRLRDIKTDDLVIIESTTSGTATSSGKRAKKIFVRKATTSAELNRRAVEGLISNISGSTLTLVHQTQRDRTWTVTVTPATIIKSNVKDASGSAALQIGQRIVAVGDPTGSTLVARWIHIIPGKATGIFKKQPLATPSGENGGTESAEVSPTPVATPSGTPAPTATPSATPTPTVAVPTPASTPITTP